jgi:hypothetical protein
LTLPLGQHAGSTRMTLRLSIDLRVLLTAAVIAAVAPIARAAAPETTPTHQVLFVCEHGNVKSLMAASYFNELAQTRGLPFRAVSRGVAPDSDSVPDFVKTPLTAAGFHVGGFRPQALSADDIEAADRVVAISTSLPPRERCSCGKFGLRRSARLDQGACRGPAPATVEAPGTRRLIGVLASV